MYQNAKIQNIVIIVLIVLSIIGSREAALGKSTEPVNQTFVTYRYIDPMSGKEAFHMLLPKGWLAEGSITWSTNPARRKPRSGSAGSGLPASPMITIPLR